MFDDFSDANISSNLKPCCPNIFKKILKNLFLKIVLYTYPFPFLSLRITIVFHQTNFLIFVLTGIPHSICNLAMHTNKDEKSYEKLRTNFLFGLDGLVRKQAEILIHVALWAWARDFCLRVKDSKSSFLTKASIPPTG